MSERNDGGPAFARTSSNEYGDGGCYEQRGMTLRDYFAGQALNAYLGQDEAREYGLPEIASDCYRATDAMLAERDRRESDA